MALEGSRNKEVMSFLSRLGPLLASLWARAFVILSVVPSPCPYVSTLSFSLLSNDRLSSYQSFLDILNEMNDYAGQRELIAENLMMNICIDLTKYLQELKQERKTVSSMPRWCGRLEVDVCGCRCSLMNKQVTTHSCTLTCNAYLSDKNT